VRERESEREREREREREEDEERKRERERERERKRESEIVVGDDVHTGADYGGQSVRKRTARCTCSKGDRVFIRAHWCRTRTPVEHRDSLVCSRVPPHPRWCIATERLMRKAGVALDPLCHRALSVGHRQSYL
jgi:hypothetical protein